MPSVLIVDDLISIHEMLEAVIQPTGFQTGFATDGQEGLAKYKAGKFDLVLADIDMKPMDGISLLRQLKAFDPNAVVIIMTAYASTDSAVQALKYGAFDYLQKPFRVDELLGTLRRGIEFRKFQAEHAATPAPEMKPGDIEGRLIGQSARITRLVAQVRKLASTRTPVLLIGEQGTGKSDVAELLHAATGAPEPAFVRIDCAQSSEERFRSGLLGENGEGGAWVKQARGGTLFLQHLELLAEPMQKELVGVLRNNAQTFRLVCSTTVDLEQLVDEGKFHDELFYRVASLPVELPPLRDRTEDIPLLVRHYAAQATNPAFDPKQLEFAPEALSVLKAYHWPGNLVELAQIVSKIASTSESRLVTLDQLPLRVREIRHWPSLAEYLATQERHYIGMVLGATHGDRDAAAKVLGVHVDRLS